MADRRSPAIFTVGPERSFADALAGGVVERFGRDPATLGRGVLLVASSRAVRTMSDAFLRVSGGGIVMPRIVPIGDLDAGAMPELAFDAAALDVPAAVDPLQRRLLLGRLVQRARGGRAGEAMRLAEELGRTLDALQSEEVAPRSVRDLEVSAELSAHWSRSLTLFRVLLDLWPDVLASQGLVDIHDRRRRLIDLAAEHWREGGDGFVIAAGISNAAPAIARLLRVVAGAARGAVVLSGLDVAMPEDEWRALAPARPGDPAGDRERAVESHPQFALKRLLSRMGLTRDDVRPWPGGGHRTSGARMDLVRSAMRPAAFTHRWIDEAARRPLQGVTTATFDTTAAEAQAIAIRLRGVLEVPAMTGALVTPDRLLARRVAAHLTRWGVAIDDTAGQPLSATASGSLIILLADLAAGRFAPVPLMAALKHPLTQAGEERLGWLDLVRDLDLALRGPRPAPGLAGIDAVLATRASALRAWWVGLRPALAPLERLATRHAALTDIVPALREAADTLSNGTVWQGPAGRAAADFIASLERHGAAGPEALEPDEIAPLLRDLLDDVAVRPPQGGHPRLAIYGLIEARHQQADLMILGGLSEGVWPGLPAPDPWLAPRIRRELGLPGLDRRIGEDASDFVAALGAPEVLITRANRDDSGPTVPSRFWLRLQASTGDRLKQDEELIRLTRALDAAHVVRPAVRPRPAPPPEERPTRISVTEVDRLKADPFAFYARRVLRLMALDPVDAEPSAAWRGTMVHAVLERWAKDDRCAIAALTPRARALLSGPEIHPVTRALWQPRLLAAIEWIAVTLDEERRAGRTVLAAEGDGAIDVAGVRLSGKFDRIDRLANGGLAIVDYKTGQPPSARAVAAGYSLQLGLLGLIAERGGFAGIGGRADAFEYWSLARNAEGGFGAIHSPVEGRGPDAIPADRFVARALDSFESAAGEWLTGTAPFTAKLHPEHAPYSDYDQLMRRDEWYGRG